MKRQIIFRGKRLDNGEWVEGDLVHISGNPIIITSQEEGPLLPEDCDHALEYSIDEIAPVDPATVGQWSGLLDRAGKRIFEGDIIECISSDGTPIRHYVEFCEERGYYAQYIIDGGIGCSFERNAEAGNIYQSYIDKYSKYIIGDIWNNTDFLD